MLVGKKITKEIIIKNHSQVKANFIIKSVHDDEFNDKSFSINYFEDEIPPKCTFLVKITYSPMVANLISVNHFEFICLVNNKKKSIILKQYLNKFCFKYIILFLHIKI